jgi:hypothetical protein
VAQRIAVGGASGVEVPPETLPCPACHRITTAPTVCEGLERVTCVSCGKVLRLRPALSAEQRAQARALRWAAAQIESSLTTTHRRKPRGGPDEAVDAALVRVADQLLAWSRLIHKLPSL